jgi:hypothetical protein
MKKTTNVPIFGIDLNAHRADGTPAPIDRDALQRIADTMTRRMVELTGWRAAVTSGNTRGPNDDRPEPDVLGYVDRVWVDGDRLLADLSWLDAYEDQIPIRRWFTPELLTFKTGEQYIDPVVAHASREEIKTNCSWIQ